ncbi:cell division protein FtsX [Palleronia caenipelagi]|uniref:FtsX-like permease family protein n=1 Tax=Palleronia caenipelagi TaxID=2489174 RepID=A0A547Q2Z6_9RHOB|nr:FtsX-like permease family protein [Palleronia caenipelagi]TRD20718.1 FtsX-like permease family protein [Palleronia caenipelagi]
MSRLLDLMRGDPVADRVVPPSTRSSALTLIISAIMAFLAVFALALSLATLRLADRWSSALGESATIRLTAPEESEEARLSRILAILSETPGIASFRALTVEEEKSLLTPWLGEAVPLETLPIPRLVELLPADQDYDAEGLRLRLEAEVPGAALDDHAAWRRPLVRSAHRLTVLGFGALGLILVAMAAMVTLASTASLAVNRPALRVLRLVGARDAFIARAFVRRFTLRALTGAALGTLIGLAAIWALPDMEAAGGFLTGLGFGGLSWLSALLIPLIAAIVAFWATRAAAFRALKEIP